MNQKTTIGLVIVLIVALAGVWWLESSSTPDTEKTATGPKTLFDPPVGEPTQFEWVVAGQPPLKFVMNKDKWQMTEPLAGATESGVVSADVAKIKDLKFSKAYPKGDADRPTDEMSGLNSPQRVAKLVDKSGKTFILKIGARQTLSSKTYVQKGGDDKIYVVDADLNQDLKHNQSDYRGKRVCEFTATDAQRIEATGENQFVFVHEGGKWMLDAPVKSRGDANAVNNLVRSLSNLSAEKFVEDNPKTLKPYGLDHPRLVLSVKTETKTPKPLPVPPASQPAQPEFDISQASYRVAFGGSADEKVFGKMDEPASSAIFQIPEATFKQLAVKLDDLRDKTVVDLDTQKAQKIMVRSGSESVELSREAGQWKIVAGLGSGETALAELVAVDDLLKAIKELKATGFEPTEIPSFGFGKPRSVIEITCEGKMEPERITIGDATPSKTGAYVRNDREGFVAVVKADAVNALVLRPIEFLSRDLVRFNKDMASRVDLVFPKYTVSVLKENNAWRLLSPVQGSAESSAVTALTSDLSNLRGRRVVGRENDKKTFGFDSPTVKLSITVDNPARPKPATSQPTSGPMPPEMESVPPTVYSLSLARIGDKTYGMMDGGKVICEIDAKVLDDALAEMLDTRISPMEPAQANKLSYAGSENFTLEKSGEAWKLVGEPTFGVDPAKVTEVFTALSSLRAKEFTRYAGAKLAEYGLNAPQTTISAQTADLKSVSLRLSAQGPQGGGKYASTDAQPDRVFVLKQEDVDKLSRKVKDFQKAG